MMGYLEWSDTPCRGGVSFGERNICGVYFYAAKVFCGERTPAFLLRQRLKKAAQTLRRRNIGQAVFPEPFSNLGLFEKYGVLPVNTLPLYQALAPELAWSAAETHGLTAARARIAVCGDRLNEELANTVTRLCTRSRYLLLAAPDRDGAFCRRLRREYGAALVQTKDPAQIAGADICILFSPREISSDSTILRVYRGAEFPKALLGLFKAPERIPAGCSVPQMLAALYAAGAVRREEISAGVSRRGVSQGVAGPF